MRRSRPAIRALPTVPALLVTAAAALLLAVISPGTALAAPPTATFTKTSDWGTGFEGKYTIVNPGPETVNGWRVEFDLAATISSFWDADMARSGNHYTFTAKSWNAVLGAGASASFGFIGAPGGVTPTNCRLNGASCTGSGTPSPSPTPTASPTPSPTPTTSPSPSPSPSPTPTSTAPPPGAFKKVAYFTQWGIYGRNFRVRDVETSGAGGKLTHINYAFGNVSQEGRCFEANQTGVGDAWADYQVRFTADQSVDGVADTFNQPLAGNFNQLKKLKARHPNLRVLMSLGGWTWSRFFSNAALTSSSRQAFAQSCIDLFIRGNLPLIGGEPQGGTGAAAGVFDGFDIDWEWPGSEGNAGNVIRPEDKQNFTLLLAELRRQLDALGQQTGKRYLLTAFLPADPAKINAGIEVSRVFPLLDFATIQGYDFHGSWEQQTNHQSQIFSPAADPAPQRFSADLAIRTYINQGAPANKLVLGIPAYGRGWAGVPSTNNGLYQTSTGPAPGTWEAGTEDYKVLKNRTGTRVRDTTNMALHLYSGGQFWSYDDPQLLTQKAGYIKSRGLGGSMMWTLDGDDPQGSLTAALDAALR